MTKEQWQKVKGLMALALEQPADAQRAFVRDAAGSDAELLAELTSLLDAHDRPEGFSLDRDRPVPTSWGSLDEFFDDGAVSSAGYSKICSRCQSRYGPLVFVCPQDGEALADDPQALVGVTLDGLYHIDRLIGLGAMGRVYLARHALLRDQVAIKVLRSDLAMNTDFVKRFMREGRVARSIRHPNAVTVHDLRTTAEGLTYMVQEFIDGHTLRDEMNKRGRMTLDEALEYLEPVAAALDEAQTHGVVHRDLKPENIIIGISGGKHVIKLTDLGIAKHYEPSDASAEVQTGVTEPGQVMGTPHYMSPEQWGAHPEDGGPDIDARADVYSFGVIAFELLTGRKPFEVRSVRQLCLSHISNPAPNLRDLAPEVPEAAAAAVARALSKNRADRQPTCGEFVRELRAETPSHGGDPARPAQRASWTGTGVAAIFLLAVVAGVVALWPRGGPSPVVRMAPAAPIASVECVAEVQKYRDGRPVKDPLAISIDRTLLVEKGDRLRLRLSSPRAGWLYVLNETRSAGTAPSDLRVLFPVSWVNGGSAAIADGETISLPPDASNWIEFDHERGSEAFWLVWSAEPVTLLDGIDRLTNTVDRGIVPGDRAAAIRELLAGATPASARVGDAAGLTVISGDASPLVYRLDIQHY